MYVGIHDGRVAMGYAESVECGESHGEFAEMALKDERRPRDPPFLGVNEVTLAGGQSEILERLAAK
jgi:hypothetical protein